MRFANEYLGSAVSPRHADEHRHIVAVRAVVRHCRHDDDFICWSLRDAAWCFRATTAGSRGAIRNNKKRSRDAIDARVFASRGMG